MPDGIDIAAAQLQGSQGALRVAQVRTDANSLAPLRLCAAVIVPLCEGRSQLVVSDGIVRIVAERTLQRVNGAVGIILAELHLTLVDEGIHVVGVGLEDLVVQFGGFVEAVLENQELDVVLLDLKIFGMIAVEGSVLGGGLVEIAGGEVEVAEHAITFPVVGEISLGLTQESFGLDLLAFLH